MNSITHSSAASADSKAGSRNNVDDSYMLLMGIMTIASILLAVNYVSVHGLQFSIVLLASLLVGAIGSHIGKWLVAAIFGIKPADEVDENPNDRPVSVISAG